MVNFKYITIREIQIEEQLSVRILKTLRDHLSTEDWLQVRTAFRDVLNLKDENVSQT